MRHNNVSFRTRNLDIHRSMRVFYPEDCLELSDLPNTPSCMPQISTGMEKEEETEVHLIQAMNTQFSAGTTIETKTIPTPKFSEATGVSLRRLNIPDSYIKYDVFRVDHEYPEYDASKSDVEWLKSYIYQNKSKNTMENNENDKNSLLLQKIQDFEFQIDNCEKVYRIVLSQFQNLNPHDPASEFLLQSSKMDIITSTITRLKRNLREIEDVEQKSFADASINRWEHLRKGIDVCNRLKPLVVCDKEDSLHPSAVSDPYVAFRRRIERMLTRKNRKNEEVGLEKIFRVLYSLQSSQFLLSKIVERENLKKEYQQSILQTFKQRLLMKDFRCRVVCRCISSILLHYRLKSEMDGNQSSFSRLLLGTGLTNALAEIDHSHLRWQSYLDAQQDFRSIAGAILKKRAIEQCNPNLVPDCQSKRINSEILLQGFSTQIIPKRVRYRNVSTSAFPPHPGDFESIKKVSFDQDVCRYSSSKRWNPFPRASLITLTSTPDKRKTENVTSASKSFFIRCRYGRGGRISFAGSRSFSYPFSKTDTKISFKNYSKFHLNSNLSRISYEIPKPEVPVCKLYLPALDTFVDAPNFVLQPHPENVPPDPVMKVPESMSASAVSPNSCEGFTNNSTLTNSCESVVSSISSELSPPLSMNLSPDSLKLPQTEVLLNGKHNLSVL